MLLALDVGNTNITAGIFKDRRLIRQWRHETWPEIPVAALARELERAAGAARERVDSAVYGSVVPRLDRTLEEAVLKGFGRRPLAVKPSRRLGLGIEVRRPSEVGVDRLLNALAAFARVKGPAVVIDFGTATTFDCVSGRGDYVGGVILPGPRMSAQALAERTAKLPLVAVRKPRRVIGRDTVECLQSGLYFGYLGMIDKVLRLTMGEMRRTERRAPKVLATGGLSRLFGPDLPRGVALAPQLTLEGLLLAYERITC
ncbi:MAG: type III pantothenate kinase [Elusimicrobia bacterium]|nr:type III pantothenate kinase [Elusimicrobiota bacterium]